MRISNGSNAPIFRSPDFEIQADSIELFARHIVPQRNVSDEARHFPRGISDKVQLRIKYLEEKLPLGCWKYLGLRYLTNCGEQMPVLLGDQDIDIGRNAIVADVAGLEC